MVMLLVLSSMAANTWHVAADAFEGVVALLGGDRTPRRVLGVLAGAAHTDAVVVTDLQPARRGEKFGAKNGSDYQLYHTRERGSEGEGEESKRETWRGRRSFVKRNDSR